MNRIVRLANVGHSAQRGGYSLLELAVGLSAAVMLMGGMASAIVVSTQSLKVADTGAGARAVSTDVQRDFLADIQRAISFSERTATAATFTVPDRTGDGRPETLRYAWSGVAGAPLTLQMNGGTIQSVAVNVQQWQLSYRTTSITAPVVPDESVPQLGRLLFVSAGVYTPPTLLQQLDGQTGTVKATASELPKISLFGYWGFNVSLIAATQSASDFTKAFGANDVIFVSSEPGTSVAQPNLTTSTLGIVNENPLMTSSFGFYTGTGSTTGTIVEIGSVSHYITSSYTALQQIPVVSTATKMQSFPLTQATSMAILGLNVTDNGVNFATLAKGQLSIQGLAITGRRAQLPWAASPFDATTLTTTGQTLLRTTLLWAAGAGTDGTPSLVTVGPTSTSNLAGYFYQMSTLMVATPITLTAKGEMHELTAYARSNGLPLRLAIYSDGGGVPKTMIAQTGLLNSLVLDTWITGPIPAVVLTPGTYWMAASLSDDTQFVYFSSPSGVSASQISKTTFTTGFPSSWAPGSGGQKTSYTRTQLLIYGSYIPVP